MADETNLAAIAFSMYHEHKFYNSTSGFYIHDSYHDIHHVWGTRPLFFSFLVNIIHIIFGYNAENVFFVNALGGVITLLLFYGIIECWFSKNLALVGMILLASYPVLVLCLTSGGFEIINLLFALLSFYLFKKYLTTKKGIDLERLGLTLVLLSQIRYESVIFTICFLIIYIFLYLRYENFKNFTYKIFFIPFLLLPVAWQRLTTMTSEQLMGDVASDRAILSFSDFGSKMSEFFEFFSSNTNAHNTIPIIFYIGIIGIIYGIWKIINDENKRNIQNISLIIYSLLSSLLLFFIINIYNQPQGGISHPTSIRLGIIFLPFIIFGSIVLIHEISVILNIRMRYISLISIGFLLWFWPVTANNQSVNTLVVSREYKILLNYLKKNYPSKNIIIISESPGLYTPHRWGAVYFPFANDNKDDLLDKLKSKLVQEILVFQSINSLNGLPTPETKLIDHFHLEKLFEKKTSGEFSMRISKVINYK